MQIMMTYQLHQRLSNKVHNRVDIIACTPGMIQTQLNSSFPLWKRICMSPLYLFIGRPLTVGASSVSICFCILVH
jgi:hypothetical protein